MDWEREPHESREVVEEHETVLVYIDDGPSTAPLIIPDPGYAVQRALNVLRLYRNVTVHVFPNKKSAELGKNHIQGWAIQQKRTNACILEPKVIYHSDKEGGIGGIQAAAGGGGEDSAGRAGAGGGAEGGDDAGGVDVAGCVPGGGAGGDRAAAGGSDDAGGDEGPGDEAGGAR